MIPNKSNFKFQELTPITGVKPYVIRFWETEFEDIAPISSENGQKIYSRKDVEVILKIKKLLFEDKLSISQAKIKMSSSFEETLVSKSPFDCEYEDNSKESIKRCIEKSLEIIQKIKIRRNW